MEQRDSSDEDSESESGKDNFKKRFNEAEEIEIEDHSISQFIELKELKKSIEASQKQTPISRVNDLNTDKLPRRTDSLADSITFQTPKPKGTSRGTLISRSISFALECNEALSLF